MNTNTFPDRHPMLNKVPEVTLFFWLIKMMSTTVGETGADFLNVDMHLGLAGVSVVTGVLLAAVLTLQMRARRYVPVLYWSTVLLISVFGTLITDHLTDTLGVPLSTSSAVFGMGLGALFAVWFAVERTLSIHAVDTRRREAFYLGAILLTFALGTAVGDWIAEGLGIGFGYAGLLFGGLIAATAVAHFRFRANPVLCFWTAYILTRPFGASSGDLLSKPLTEGGLGLGTSATSAIFAASITALVAYLSLSERRLGARPAVR